MSKLSRLVRDTRAAEIAELAVVLPILFTMIFAIFSFGRAYNVYSTVTRAAEEGARVAVTPVCATCSSPGCALPADPRFPCDATVATAVANIINASHLDPSQIIATSAPTLQDGCPPPAPATHSCNASSSIWICRDALLNTASSNPPACGTVVTFKYRYQFLPIPFSTVQSIDIPATSQMRVEY
jgi:hypothetical protein